RKRLLDGDPWVRLRAAQGLLAAGEKAAIPVLIELLNEDTIDVGWQAEELLHWAARSDAPRDTIGAGSVMARAQCRGAWRKWWKRNATLLDLTDSRKHSLIPSLRLVVDRLDQDDPANPCKGRVWLCGSDGTIRWQLSNLPSPGQVHLLPSHCLMVSESV